MDQVRRFAARVAVRPCTADSFGHDSYLNYSATKSNEIASMPKGSTGGLLGHLPTFPDLIGGLMTSNIPCILSVLNESGFVTFQALFTVFSVELSLCSFRIFYRSRGSSSLAQHPHTNLAHPRTYSSEDTASKSDPAGRFIECSSNDTRRTSKPCRALTSLSILVLHLPSLVVPGLRSSNCQALRSKILCQNTSSSSQQRFSGIALESLNSGRRDRNDKKMKSEN